MEKQIINCSSLSSKEINFLLRVPRTSNVALTGILGQRFIGSGMKDIDVEISGTPGNALGAYLDGGKISVKGNAQDAVGDTMNEGNIIIHGSVGDALGYSMRGGKIYVKENSGYRTGVHIKEYADKKPLIVIGGKTGSFLGEYLAGGTIVVLGLGIDGTVAGNFTGTGMHGGVIYLRTDVLPPNLPKQVSVFDAGKDDIFYLESLLSEYFALFNLKPEEILSSHFFVLRPNARNPYKQLYVLN
jgi:glutamate synthase domain-containing protein 3